MEIPVYILTEEGMEPNKISTSDHLPEEEGYYYVIAGNGIFMRKTTGFLGCFKKVDEICLLPSLDIEDHVECNLPKIPVELVGRTKQFFKEVLKKHNAESCVILYFNQETEEYKIYASKQSATYVGVKYEYRLPDSLKDEFEDFLRVGTIHSHCDFGASHSMTDVEDEADFDGVHITFGHNNKEEFSIVSAVVVNGMRKQIDPERLLGGIEHVKSNFYKLTENLEHDISDWIKEVNQ